MISERQLEDFICKNPEYSLWEGVEIIGRQVSLAHGRLDILAWNGSQTLVIELKARAIKEKDIGQILRYKRDIVTELWRIGSLEYPDWEDLPQTPRLKLFQKWWSERHGLSAEGRYAVIPVLIGASVDFNTQAAADGGEIEIKLWQCDTGQNSLSFSRPEWLHWNKKPYPPWLKILNGRIVDSCKTTVVAEELEALESARESAEVQ